MPSAFIWPFVATMFREPSEPAVVYPSRGIGTLWQAEPAVGPAALAALIGRTRAGLLAMLDAPLSTSEVAQRSGLEHRRRLAAPRRPPRIGARRRRIVAATRSCTIRLRSASRCSRPTARRRSPMRASGGCCNGRPNDRCSNPHYMLAAKRPRFADGSLEHTIVSRGSGRPSTLLASGHGDDPARGGRPLLPRQAGGAPSRASAGDEGFGATARPRRLRHRADRSTGRRRQLARRSDLGYTNHTDTAGLRAGHAAGFDQVIVKSALVERAPELVAELTGE